MRLSHGRGGAGGPGNRLRHIDDTLPGTPQRIRGIGGEPIAVGEITPRDFLLVVRRQLTSADYEERPILDSRDGKNALRPQARE